MTITLEIPAEMEVQLCDRAARRGQTVTDYLMSLAESEDYFTIYDWEDEADHQEAIAIIEQGLAELHAGDKGMLLEDYRAEVMKNSVPKNSVPKDSIPKGAASGAERREAQAV